MVRIGSGLGGAARVLLTLGVGAFAGGALTAHIGAQAEDAGVSFSQLMALTARVTALEDAKDKPMKVKAPFEVIDVRGQTIMSIIDTGGGVSMELGTGDQIIDINTNKGDPKILLEDGENTASLQVLKEGPVLNLDSGSGSVEIKAAGSGPSLTMNQGEEAVFSVDTAGGGPQLKVQKGSQVVRLAALPNQTGVLVDTSTHFQMGDIENIRGFVASRGDLPFAGLGAQGNDQYRVVIYNGSTSPVFEGGFDRESGQAGVFVGDSSGKRVAELTSAGGVKLKLLDPGGKEVATLGTPAAGGDGGELSLVNANDTVKLGFGEGAGASLAFKEGGTDTFSVKKDGDSGVLTLGKAESSILMKAGPSETVTVMRRGGRSTQAGIGKKATGFVIGDEGKPLAALGDNGDNKPFMAIYGDTSAPKLKAGYQTNGRLGFTIGEPSKPIATLEEGAKSAGDLTLYSGGTDISAILGVTDSGSSALRLFNGSDMGAVLAAKSDGGALRIFKGGEISAGVESDGNGTAISVFDGGKERASLLARSSGRGVVVWGSSGSPLIRLVDGGSGGSMVVSDSGGTDLMEARIDSAVGGLFCVNYKNVEKCLGRGLTGMEGFH